MSGKHESGCECPECMTYLGNNICVDIDQWMPDDASLAVFGTRDCEQRLGKNVPSLVVHATGSQEVLVSGPSTIPTTIADFIERMEEGNFATHAREDVDRFNKLMKKYYPNSEWIKQNMYAEYVDKTEKLQKYAAAVREQRNTMHEPHRDEHEACVRPNTFAIIMIATCLIMCIV